MDDTSHQQPTKKQAFVFSSKSKVLQCKRKVEDVLSGLKRHPLEPAAELPVIGSSSTPLWTEGHKSERVLTAGKVHNLRLVAQALNGMTVPAGEVFSFWKQLGRVTKRKGFVVGRELREGCMIPNFGGGICQLSNGVYNAALKAGIEVVERHAHSQVIPGSLAEVGRDATVFWNYVDLRLRHSEKFQLSVSLSKNHLHIEILSCKAGSIDPSARQAHSKRPAAEIGNCHSCGISSCFRNVPDEGLDKSLGTTSYLLDSCSPEYQKYLNSHRREGDQVILPIDGKRWRAPAYRWSVTSSGEEKCKPAYATRIALQRALRLRSLSGESGSLQKALMSFDEKLAAAYARKIDYRATHLVVSQNLLPHLWRLGVMGGRTFDVLAGRYPLEVLQSILDDAYSKHPESETLSDFRVPERLLEIESEAFQLARRVISPHTDVADKIQKRYGCEVEIIDWSEPKKFERHNEVLESETGHLVVGFPASPLGKKGVYLIQKALEGIDVEIRVLGKAEEGVELLNSVQVTVEELMGSDVLLLPAYVEHSPRPLLRALAMGVPVIASRACGLPPQLGLTLLDTLEPAAIRSQLLSLIKRPHDGNEDAG